jgi:hypothetical protein
MQELRRLRSRVAGHLLFVQPRSADASRAWRLLLLLEAGPRAGSIPAVGSEDGCKQALF